MHLTAALGALGALDVLGNALAVLLGAVPFQPPRRGLPVGAGGDDDPSGHADGGFALARA